MFNIQFYQIEDLFILMSREMFTIDVKSVERIDNY